jgi:hypothetical protein
MLAVIWVKPGIPGFLLIEDLKMGMKFKSSNPHGRCPMGEWCSKGWHRKDRKNWNGLDVDN